MKTNKTSGIIRTMIRGLLCLPLLALPLVAQNVSRLTLEESSNLQSWQTVPVTPAMLDANGKILVPTNTAEKFYRMKSDLLIPPSFTTQPASVTIASGQTTTLTVAASGTGPFTYQWYQGSVGTTTTPVGTNSPSFTTPALTATTYYWVKVTNGASAVNSSGATVTVTGGGVEPADMALIPAGDFTMGDVNDNNLYGDALPVTVTVSAFFIGKCEVTKALWDEVRTWGAANGYTDMSAGDGKAANHPVYGITWYDIVKWCNARSQKDGLTPVYTVSGSVLKTGTSEPAANWSANGYRLPTEAEWEKAARGGVSGKRFPWGTDTISYSQANYYAASNYFSYDLSGIIGNFHPTYATGLTPYSSPVGSFAANGYGLYDMVGNMWEWCWDWYEGSTYRYGATTDPRGAASGTSRVRRGGSWAAGANDCRVAFRGYNLPSIENSYIGCRVARSLVSAGGEVSPSIDTQPLSVSVASGSNASLIVAASGTAPLAYQWYEGEVGTTTTPVGTNSASFTTPALRQTTSYWVRVSNSVGNVNTNLATVTVGSTTHADMALIPAGAFTMGRTYGDEDGDAPPVTVAVSEFYILKYEVTKALWDEVRLWGVNNGYTDVAVGDGKASNHPVQTIRWFDTLKWCNARSEKDGLMPVYTVSGAVMKTGVSEPTANWSANGYRLPTEAEWEKAARGGVSGARFPWGTDDISHSKANYFATSNINYDLSRAANDHHPSYRYGTSPVGVFSANGYGLHDMAGNVWEWCWDWFGASTYVNGATDPRGAASGTLRVLRGGSWDTNAAGCRAACRYTTIPTHSYRDIGFRIARSSVP